MHFSILGACLLLAATFGHATPVATTPQDVSNDLASLPKRCCILCDNPYAKCGSKDKRQPVDTEEAALFGPATKRCCINCDNNRCKRDEAPAQWPEKRCCILCDNPYARCGGEKDKREVVGTLEDALFGVERL